MCHGSLSLKVQSFTDQLTGVKQSEILFSLKMGCRQLATLFLHCFKKKQSKNSVESFSVHIKRHEYGAKLNNC